MERQVAASTKNQALAAILLLYREVLAVELPWLTEAVIRLLHGAGIRLLEGLRLRVKDVELSRREIIVREGKGNKDRVTMLPESVRAGSGGGTGAGVSAGCAGRQVSERGHRVGLAIRVCRGGVFQGPEVGGGAATPHR